MVENIVMKGMKVSPRGSQTRELENVILEYPHPMSYVFRNEKRLINPVFHLVELFYFLNGRTDTILVDYVSQMKEFQNDYGRFGGSYGPSIYESLPFVIRELGRDKDSRRAVIPILRSHHLVPGTIDIPCNVLLEFKIRSDSLQMDVITRSQDLYRGFLYDTLEFQLLQFLLSKLFAVNVGAYIHHIASMHLYEKDFENAVSSLTVPVKSNDFDFQLEPKIFTVFTDPEDLWQYVRRINVEMELASQWPERAEDFDDISRAIINWKLRRKCLSSGLYSDWVNWWLDQKK